MNARILAVAFGSLAVLSLSSSAFAQTTTDSVPSTVQAPAAHEHDHGAAPAETASKSGCAMMAHRESNDTASATPPAQHEHDAPPADAAKPAAGGCCGGMMKGHQSEPAADQSAKSAEHSCCCSGMKM